MSTYIIQLKLVTMTSHTPETMVWSFETNAVIGATRADQFAIAAEMKRIQTSNLRYLVISTSLELTHNKVDR